MTTRATRQVTTDCHGGGQDFGHKFMIVSNKVDPRSNQLCCRLISYFATKPECCVFFLVSTCCRRTQLGQWLWRAHYLPFERNVWKMQELNDYRRPSNSSWTIIMLCGPLRSLHREQMFVTCRIVINGEPRSESYCAAARSRHILTNRVNESCICDGLRWAVGWLHPVDAGNCPQGGLKHKFIGHFNNNASVIETKATADN